MESQKNNKVVEAPLESWKKAIRDIYEIRHTDRLVIFVGSGVSRNSKIPTWNELIVKMANELKIPNEPLSINDYLTIAQDYYNKCEDKRQYYDKLKEMLGSEVPSNPIDDVIFDLTPRHIVTTNYDKLLENSTNKSPYEYTPIVKDEDFVDLRKNTGSFKHIIKMHGDIDEPETMVLREEDYLHYELSHPLMSAYLKALLTEYSFLFIGYALNDYNLKQIIEWLNYFTKEVEEKRPHFLIRVAKTEESERYEVKVKLPNNETIEERDCIKINQPEDENERKEFFVKVIKKNGNKQGYYFLKNENPLEGGSSQDEPDKNREYAKNKQNLDIERLKKYGIQVVNLDDSLINELEIPEKDMPKVKETEKSFFENNNMGKLLYLCLHHLKDYNQFMNRYYVQDFVKNRITILNEYDQISIKDVLCIFEFHQVKTFDSTNEIKGRRNVVSLKISSDVGIPPSNNKFQKNYLEQLDKYFDVSSEECEKNKKSPGSKSVLSQFFRKSNISEISIRQGRPKPLSYYDRNKLFNMYLDNDYKGIRENLEPGRPKHGTESELFYRLILNDTSDKFKEFSLDRLNKDKKNSELSPINTTKNNLQELFTLIRKYEFCKKFNPDEQTKIKAALLKKLNSLDKDVTVAIREYYIDLNFNHTSPKKLYEDDAKSFKGVNFCYDYYFFIFKNNFPILNEKTKEYFSRYVEKLLSSDYGNINEIDFDIIVKYSERNTLKNIFEKDRSKNSSRKIEGNLFKKLENLCVSLSENSNSLWWEHLCCFILVLTYVNLEYSKRKISEIFNTISDMCKNVDKESRARERSEFGEVLKVFFDQNNIDSQKTKEILDLLNKSPIVHSSPITKSSLKQDYSFGKSQ